MLPLTTASAPEAVCWQGEADCEMGLMPDEGESADGNGVEDAFEVRTRAGRVVRWPVWLQYECNFGQDIDAFEDIPESYTEVLESSADKDEWIRAMQREHAALVDNGTWELSVPTGKIALGGRMVFCIKRDENGNILKYKARFVAKACGQIYESDYCDTCAPTSKLTTIRASLALAIRQGDVVKQIDVKSAYLNASISEEMYIQQPHGLAVSGPAGGPAVSGPELYCRLRKSLYDLKQAGREWNRMLDSWLVKQGFARSKADHCLYVQTKEQHRMFIVIWVADILYFGDDVLVD